MPATLHQELLDLRRSERRRDLQGLAAQGVILDVEEELAELESLDAAAYAKRLDTVRRRYRRDGDPAPDVQRVHYDRDGRQVAAPDAQAEAEAVYEFARSRGIFDGAEALRLYKEHRRSRRAR